ncbi:MAG: hypothetical protein ACM3S2_14355 [Ignavibacteriales bacterium]
MKSYRKIFLLLQLIAFTVISGQESVHLDSSGVIPVWLTNGPFEVETVGFGDMSAKQAIDEVNVTPVFGAEEKNPAVNGGVTKWNFLSTGSNGYTDIREYYGWKTFNSTEKVWYEKIVYAFARINSPKEQTAEIKFGGNSIIQIFLNGEEIYKSLSPVNGEKDKYSRKISLREGENRLLVKIANSHVNHSLSFFDPVRYEWGFYLRLTAQNNEALKDISMPLDLPALKADYKITPTFFYRKIAGVLQQKYIVEIISPVTGTANAEVSFQLGKAHHNILLKNVKYGLNLKEFYVPGPVNPVVINTSLKLGGKSFEKPFTLEQLPKYELYFMPTTHMDIGYTNPQPVVVERQLNTLDQVIEKCRTDKGFRWTIETMWLLENYRQSRSKERFEQLISLIKSGRIAVSPIYSNPFTGWIGENEMLESFRWAQEYKEKYGIGYYAAVYNDVPGQSWALPQALKMAGVKVLVDGINEIFSNYKFQKSLPKVFNWVGSNSDTLMLYLTEAYTEGSRYGLERDTSAIENRIWHTINNLKQREYPFSKVLISGAFSDNSGIAIDQYNNALKWNEKYEYPKFIISTLNDFSRDLAKEKLSSLKTIKGDWTSDWDILFQGEAKRMVKYRWVQNNLPSAEILSTFNSLEDPHDNSFAGEISSVYKNLLEFSGHGSGLEYGFGSAFENKLTDDYREGYVQNSYLKTQELLERTAYRLTVSKESFDSHGIIVFNTLSWDRSIPVEIEFPKTDLNAYSVIDLSDKKEISSFRNGDKLYFLAAGVPGAGYKQYELINASKHEPAEMKDAGSIQNEFYKISISDKGLSITGASGGQEILSAGKDIKPFMPVMRRSLLKEGFVPVTDKMIITGTEKNSVYEELCASYQNEIFSGIKFRLWKKLNRIDITLSVNLGGLKETASTEEYGLPFIADVPESKIQFESLGGLMSPGDRFAAAGTQSFAIRRVIDIPADEGHLVIASPDCRIFMLDTAGNKNLLAANLINNFPVSWNRNEDNKGTVEFNFSIVKTDSKDFDVTGFGYEAAGEQVARRSWYRKGEPVKQYLKLSNPWVKLISLKPAGNDVYQLILQNSKPHEKQNVSITSGELLNKAAVSEVNFTGEKVRSIPVKNNSIEIEMFPNSITKIIVQKYHH